MFKGIIFFLFGEHVMSLEMKDIKLEKGMDKEIQAKINVQKKYRVVEI